MNRSVSKQLTLLRDKKKGEKRKENNRVVHFCVLQSNTTSNSKELPNEDRVDTADDDNNDDKVTLIYCYQKVRYSG